MDEVRIRRMVGCITYTNTASHEIEARFRHHGQPGDENFYDVCTIHSLSLNHIFRPFCHLIEGYKEGLKVLTPDSEEFAHYVTSTCERHGRYNVNFGDIEEFASLRVSPEGEPVGNAIERGAITPEMARLLENNPACRFRRFSEYYLLLASAAPEAARNPQ